MTVTQLMFVATRYAVIIQDTILQYVRGGSFRMLPFIFWGFSLLQVILIQDLYSVFRVYV
jgi:hypothetical protein